MIPDKEPKELTLLSFYVTRIVRVTRHHQGYVFRKQLQDGHHGDHQNMLSTFLGARVRGINDGRERQFRISIF